MFVSDSKKVVIGLSGHYSIGAVFAILAATIRFVQWFVPASKLPVVITTSNCAYKIARECATEWLSVGNLFVLGSSSIHNVNAYTRRNWAHQELGLISMF